MKKYITLLYLLSLCTGAYAQKQPLRGADATGKNYEAVAHAICDGINNDEEKARAIYNWVTNNIALDLDAIKNPNRDPEDLKTVFNKRKGTSDGYATLYVAMCREVSIPAVVIEGYAKDWTFDKGDKMYVPRHAWCAVLIDGQWHLADPTMGAGGIEYYKGWLPTQMDKLFGKKEKDEIAHGKKERFRFAYDENYFMMHPLYYRFTHLPADPIWQLTTAPMPLEVFEAGDTAIAVYNKQTGQAMQGNASLLHVATLTESERILDYADRAYDFNKRYESILGIKENLDVARMWGEREGKSLQPLSREVLETSKLKLKKATDYLKAQKKNIPAHYAALEKKNEAKSRETGEQLRRIRTDDKVWITKCNRYRQLANREDHELNEKYAAAKKIREGLSAEKINSIKTETIEKPASHTMLRKLADSIAARNARISTLGDEMDTQKQQLIATAAENDNRLKELHANFIAADSMIAQELNYRTHLRDSRDDEVMHFTALYNKIKFGKVDALQKYYIASNDTLHKMQDAWLKNYEQLLTMYKNNLKDMETYKKWNSKETAVTGQYYKAVLDFTFCLDQYTETLKILSGIEKAYQSTYADMVKIYEFEIKMADKIQDAEDYRKKKENEHISEARHFEEGDNERLQRKVKQMEREADKALEKLES